MNLRAYYDSVRRIAAVWNGLFPDVVIPKGRFKCWGYNEELALKCIWNTADQAKHLAAEGTPMSADHILRSTQAQWLSGTAYLERETKRQRNARIEMSSKAAQKTKEIHEAV